MSDPVVVVTGLGRCGTSLAMQMLAAGGLSCTGQAPSYEAREAAPLGPIDPAWFAAQGGRAVKVLDPHISLLPPEVERRTIWMDRHPREQARSQAKFAHLLGGYPRASRAQVRGMQTAVIRDRRRALASLGPGVHLLAYEMLLARPDMGAAFLALAAGHAATLDLQAMAAQVRKSDPRCAPGLDMEAALMELADRHGGYPMPAAGAAALQATRP